MTTYQPEIIQKFADRLYARAVTAIFASTIVGVIIGLAVEPFFITSLPGTLSTHVPDWTSPVLFGIIGLAQGFERAATLKLQAQTALCQMQIERNTRLAAEAGTKSPPLEN